MNFKGEESSLMATQTKSERRRKSRVDHKSRLILSGTDAEGYNFAEDTETVTVSRNGAAVRTSYVLALGQELSVRMKDSNRVGQFQVVWLGQEGTPSEGRIGLEWVAIKQFWGIEFPPEDWGDN
jgi:hypothetical protein